MSKQLADEMREAAFAIREAAQRTPCYSVIQDIVTAATDHIAAEAGNVEKNARITELEELLKGGDGHTNLRRSSDGSPDKSRAALDDRLGQPASPVSRERG